MKNHIFISAAEGDAARAEELCATLETSGLLCWNPRRDLPPGTHVTVVTRAAIEEAGVFLLV